MLSDGMNLNPEVTIRVLENKVALAAVREAQLEAAVQQLLADNESLRRLYDEATREQADSTPAAEG